MIRRHLGLRIPLTLAAVTLLVVGVEQTLVAYQDARLEYNTAKNYIGVLARTTAGASVNPLLVRDYPQLQNTCLGLLETPGVVAVRIDRSDGARVVDLTVDKSYAPDQIIWQQAPIQVALAAKTSFTTDTSSEGDTIGQLAIGLDRGIFWRRAVQSAQRGLIQALALVIALTVALTFVIRRSVVKPIQKVAHVAKRIGAGDLDQAFPRTRSDEIGQLEQEIDSMRQSLDLLLTEAQSLRVQAEEANDAKTQFLANMSHEMRTPLTAVLGFAEELLLEISNVNLYSDQDATEYTDQKSDTARHHLDHLNAIRRNGQHLLAVINDILDLAKIEAGHSLINKGDISLTELLDDLEPILATMAERTGLPFGLTRHAPLPSSIQTDDQRVRQVLINLVGNAVKFTSKGSVHVNVSFVPSKQTPANHGTLQFVVTDTGIGIQDEVRHRIFEAFNQGDISMSRSYGGTGLGLSISRRLAQDLGGDISILDNADTQPGHGTSFMFTIDAGQVQINHDEPDKTLAPRASSTKPSNWREGLSILLVEDGMDNQRLIKLILERAGAKVEVANNGQMACDALIHDAKTFDVVLMDMQMPVMDGYTATRTLRKTGVDAPIIALTAHAMSGAREQCLEAGCDDYTTKPVKRQVLLELIGEWAGTKSNKAISLHQALHKPEPPDHQAA